MGRKFDAQIAGPWILRDVIQVGRERHRAPLAGSAGLEKREVVGLDLELEVGEGAPRVRESVEPAEPGMVEEARQDRGLGGEHEIPIEVVRAVRARDALIRRTFSSTIVNQIVCGARPGRYLLLKTRGAAYRSRSLTGLSRVSRCQMRKVLFIFGQLTDMDVEWLAKNGRRRRLSAKSVLIEQGVPVDTLYLVLEGELAVIQSKREIARLGAGEIVGEMSFIDKRPPSATVSAATDVVVFAIAKVRLEQRLEQDVGFAARFYKSVATFLSDRVRKATAPRQGQEADDADELDDSGARQHRSRGRALQRSEPAFARRMKAQPRA